MGEFVAPNSGVWWSETVPVGANRKAVPLKYKLLNDRAIPPKFAHDGDAGFDFFLPEDVIIPPFEDCSRHCLSVKIPLGIAVEVPKGYFLAIVLRSSTGLKTTARLSNSFGVIDSGYRGEIALILDSFGMWPSGFKRGDRIAQGIIIPIPDVCLVEADELSDSERGEGGFGSTGR